MKKINSTSPSIASSVPLPKPKRFYQRWWFWILIVFIALVGLGGLAAMKSWKAQQLQSFDYLKNTTTVQKRTFKKTVSTNGEITPDHTTALSFSTPGRVKHVNYQVGDNVNKDDIIAETDKAEKIKAPFDGKILTLNTFVDDQITPTSPIVEVGFRSNHVEFTASEAEIVDLRVNQHTTMTIPSLNNGKDSFDGKVTFVDTKKQVSSSSTATQTTEAGYTVHISADNLPEDVQQLIGLSVDVVIDIYQANTTLSLEPGAIQYDDNDDAFVYLPPVINDDFIAKAEQTTDITSLLTTKSITTGVTGDDYTEITSGLKDGEKVLIYIAANTVTQ